MLGELHLFVRSPGMLAVGSAAATSDPKYDTSSTLRDDAVQWLWPRASTYRRGEFAFDSHFWLETSRAEGDVSSSKSLMAGKVYLD